jgi:hypothetical protein
MDVLNTNNPLEHASLTCQFLKFEVLTPLSIFKILTKINHFKQAIISLFILKMYYKA